MEFDSAEQIHEELDLKLVQAIRNGDTATVKQLLQEGADVWYRDEQGVSPLHVACEIGNRDIVSILLQEGHAWNAIDTSGTTAGEYAKRNGHEEVYEMLIEEGCRVELILGMIEAKEEKDQPSNIEYLSRPLKYSEDGTKLFDFEDNGVMMGWEKPLMDRHAEILCPREGLDILNIGFGLGLVDMAIEKYKPRSHTIVEAHPDVYDYMIKEGWDKKPGVKIIFGRWQDVLDQFEIYDGIFFDTFGEFYKDLRDFHEEIINFLKPDGIYSFFNGLGATNNFFHDVYCRIAEMHLSSVGLQTEFIEIPIDPSDEKIWEGVKRRYWTLDTYRLPICRFLS
ncbi:14631_t:CDS:2 [Acaulospora morrowiae]|uniref:Arginine N-methyltransferase 2 n=1 Tax=Acaulospora morrowiae TaxID=94023 RepID=A0A9N8ZKI6_9GLOM|nr:14631_t:CDS:2 [Acaulospora morrowiae]